MILLEYEAKKILSNYNIPIPRGVVIKKEDSLDTISLPCVLKSQVPIGGRGKLGGVKVANTATELTDIATQLFHHPIKGFTPSTLLKEEVIAIDKEFYLSLRINREMASIFLVAHTDGGVDIEEHPQETFYKKQVVSKHDVTSCGQTLAEYLGLEEKEFLLTEIIERLYNCFTREDATLLEINPLVLTKQNTLVAADCKMELDDASDFRHPDWEFEAKKHNANFVTLHEHGTIATVANGAGLAMATVDGVAGHNLLPANFLDIGGGANEASVYAAFQNIMQYPNIHGIVINIFAGITRCDEVAKAILQAKTKITNLPPLYIRLAGTNSDEAKKVLQAHDIILYRSLDDCLVAAKEATQ